MSKRIARIVILAEDLRSSAFLRRYAKRAWDHREIYVVPFGSGSAEQFVRGRCPVEVSEQRARTYGTDRNAALVVHTDADTGTVEDRHARLAESLERAGHEPRRDHELIAIVVPKRHTETWLHGLCGTIVSEDQDCKRELQHHDAKVRPAADELYRLTRRNAPAQPPHLPALKRAIPELRRLENK